MKKVVKLGAYLFGSLALLTGATSCEKTEEIEMHECCTGTYTDGSENFKYCEDDAYITNNSSYDYTWEQWKAFFIVADVSDDALTVSCKSEEK